MTLPRAEVDHRRCARHGLCAASAPSAFRLGGDGRVRVANPTDPEAARAAARLCPAQAISVRDDGR